MVIKSLDYQGIARRVPLPAETTRNYDREIDVSAIIIESGQQENLEDYHSIIVQKLKNWGEYLDRKNDHERFIGLVDETRSALAAMRELICRNPPTSQVSA